MKLMNTQASTKPVLYSLRNCPYAMRARIAIFKSGYCVVLRDVVLSNKPSAMLVASPKAEVPVLVLGDGEVIEESLDVMLWALNQCDPNNLLESQNKIQLADMLELIQVFDVEFKTLLEQYKCSKRYQEPNLLECRALCEPYLKQLEARLEQHSFVMGEGESLVDIAILPFIRQFARVERQWYLQAPYPKLRQWLNNYLQSPMFTKVMAKYPLWQEDQEPVYFGANITRTKKSRC